MYSGITSGRVLDGEFLYTKILDVNLFAFAYRLFHRDFSSLNWLFAFVLILLFFWITMQTPHWVERNLYETVCWQMETN